MTRYLNSIVVAILVIGCLVQGALLLRTRPSFATLPIFIPASLEYEKVMRSERNQPAGQGGAEASVLVRVLADERLDPATQAAIAPLVEDLRKTREQLLAARNQRHALNIALMDVGVSVAGELTPAQWNHIQMNRDNFQARQDAASFDRLLGRLHQ